MAGLFGECLQDHFAEPFACDHDVGWPYRLVGTDEDDACYSLLQGHLCDRMGAENVVANTLCRVVFDHRHMLVGCGMVDHLGLKDPEYFLENSNY